MLKGVKCPWLAMSDDHIKMRQGTKVVSALTPCMWLAHCLWKVVSDIRWEVFLKLNKAAVRSVTLSLANKFSQCTFSVTEHYDLFSGLIILLQAWWSRPYDVIAHRPHRTDRETAAGKAQRYHTDLKLIYMLPITHYTTIRQFRVHGHFKSVRNNRRHFYKTATPTR